MTSFFSNDTATSEIYTLSLHDALPISDDEAFGPLCEFYVEAGLDGVLALDRKSTRLNSSHLGISYAVFCLKKKKDTNSNFPTCTYVSTIAPVADDIAHHKTAIIVRTIT